MMRVVVFVCLFVAVGLVAPELVLAQSASPYDMTYKARKDTVMRAAPEAGSAAKGNLARGTAGIVLRWCRPEIPFNRWQFGGRGTWRILLDERVCEISSGGKVGFVDGVNLDPAR